MVLQFFSTGLFQYDCYIENKSNPKLDLVGSPHVVNANTHVLCAISRPKANTVQWLTAAGKQARKKKIFAKTQILFDYCANLFLHAGWTSVLRKRKKKPDRTSEN